MTRHRPTIGDVPSLSRWAPSFRLQYRAAVMMVGLQCLIAVTGATVRVTGSGLGCPTWPQCTPDSLVPVANPSVNPAQIWIEFGNRMLSAVVGIGALVVLGLALASRPRRKRQITLAATMLLGVFIQAVVGGLTVLTGLSWWLVCLHFLPSPLLVWFAILHLRSVTEGEAKPRWLLPLPLRGLLISMVGVFVALLIAGTLVTAAGPHAGDIKTPRLDVPVTALTQVHGDLLVAFLAMLAALGFALRAVGASKAMWRRYLVLLAVTIAQGLVGFIQFLENVPIALVVIHVVGAVVVTASTASLWCAGRDRGPRVPAESSAGSESKPELAAESS